MKKKRNPSIVQWLLSLPGALVLFMGLYTGEHILYPNTAAAGEKMTICHVPPGNPDNFRTITVTQKGAKRHFKKHKFDSLGPCGPPDEPIVTTNDRPWLVEADFDNDPTLYAQLGQVIVFDLEPATHYNERDFTNTVRYKVSETANFSFCIPLDEPHITALQLLNESGDIVMYHDSWDECIDVTPPPGLYTMNLFHDGSLIGAEGKKAFLYQPQPESFPQDDLDAPVMPEPDVIAFKAPNGKFVANVNGKLQATATSVLNWGATLDFTTSKFLIDGYNVVSWNIDGLSSGVAPTDTGFTFVASPDATPSASVKFQKTDLGAGQFTLQAKNVINVNSWATGLTGSAPIVVESDNTLHYDYNLQQTPTTFTTDYEGYDCYAPCDSDYYFPLQEGEVALYNYCDFKGAAFVFRSDVSDFSIYNDAAGYTRAMGDNKVKSMRLGPNTYTILYDLANFSGSLKGYTSHTSCLDATASSMKVTTDIKQVVVRTNACPGCNLTGIDLSGEDLTDGLFQGTNFSQANLTNTNLRITRLENAVFSGATTVGTNFFYATLTCTDLSGTDLSTAILDDDPMIEKDLLICRSDLSEATLNIDTFPPASLKYLDLTNVNFLNGDGAILSTDDSPLDLSGAILSGAKGLGGVILDNADFSCTTDGSGAPLCTQLIGTNLNKASLQHTILKGALLNGANLNYTNLEGADLSGAQLQKTSSALTSAASLEGAYLKNANLAQADLSGVNLSNANFYSTASGTCPSAQWRGKCATAQDALLNSTDFADAYLSGVDFSGAILQGANFKQAVLSGVKFTNADLSVDATTGVAANFGGAYLQGADFTDATGSNASFNSAYTDLLSDSGGILAFQLPAGNLEFTDCEANDRSCTGCVFFTYNGITVVPLTTSNNTCPDGTFGPCTNTEWENPTIPIENATPASSADLSNPPEGCSLDFNW